MAAAGNDREQPSARGRRGRLAAGRARLSRAGGEARHPWPRLAAGLRRATPAMPWRRPRAPDPDRIDPINPIDLWLLLLLVAITLASGLATLAQLLRVA